MGVSDIYWDGVDEIRVVLSGEVEVKRCLLDVFLDVSGIFGKRWEMCGF